MDRPPPQDPEIDAVASLWSELGAHLQARFRQLNLEMRHYPTPIARCDDQLPKLIEQRDHARAELTRMRSVDADSSGSGTPPIQALVRFVEAAPPTDDETELALRARLRAAVLARKV